MINDRISELDRELRQLRAAQSKIDRISSQIDDIDRLVQKVKSAVAFDVRPVASFASRELDEFQVAAGAEHGLRNQILTYLTEQKAILTGKLAEAQREAQLVVEVDNEHVSDAIIRNVSR